MIDSWNKPVADLNIWKYNGYAGLLGQSVQFDIGLIRCQPDQYNSYLCSIYVCVLLKSQKRILLNILSNPLSAEMGFARHWWKSYPLIYVSIDGIKLSLLSYKCSHMLPSCLKRMWKIGFEVIFFSLNFKEKHFCGADGKFASWSTIVATVRKKVLEDYVAETFSYLTLSTSLWNSIIKNSIHSIIWNYQLPILKQIIKQWSKALFNHNMLMLTDVSVRMIRIYLG